MELLLYQMVQHHPHLITLHLLQMAVVIQRHLHLHLVTVHHQQLTEETTQLRLGHLHLHLVTVLHQLLTEEITQLRLGHLLHHQVTVRHHLLMVEIIHQLLHQIMELLQEYLILFLKITVKTGDINTESKLKVFSILIDQSSVHFVN